MIWASFVYTIVIIAQRAMRVAHYPNEEAHAMCVYLIKFNVIISGVGHNVISCAV